MYPNKAKGLQIEGPIYKTYPVSQSVVEIESTKQTN